MRTGLAVGFDAQGNLVSATGELITPEIRAALRNGLPPVNKSGPGVTFDSAGNRVVDSPGITFPNGNVITQNTNRPTETRQTTTVPVSNAVTTGNNILAGGQIGSAPNPVVGSNNNSVGSGGAGGGLGSGSGNAQLDALVNLLLQGGTSAEQTKVQQRNNEVGTLQAQRGQFDPQAALAQTQGLLAQTLRQALERTLPTITRGAEAAGTSQSALRALLAQDAATKAAESASAVGVRAITDFGNVGNNISQILEALTRSDPNANNALLQALQLSINSQQANANRNSTVNANNSVGNRTIPINGVTQSPFPGTTNTPVAPGVQLIQPVTSTVNAGAQQNFGPQLTDSQIVDILQRGGITGGALQDAANQGGLFQDRFIF